MVETRQSMNPDIYVIIPVYNEASKVGSVIRAVRKIYKNVVCVNDGSSDDSRGVIARSDAILVNHPINLGQGAALQTGIEYALQDPKAAYFVTFDADGQHRLEDVQHMLETLKHNKLDLVLGSRFLGEAENITLLKRLVLRAAIVFSNRTTGLKLTDAHNGLRVFNRHVAERMRISMPDMAHASEITHRIAEEQFKFKEVPITIRYSDYSRAKGQPVMNAINIAFDLFFQRIAKK